MSTTHEDTSTPDWRAWVHAEMEKLLSAGVNDHEEMIAKMTEVVPHGVFMAAVDDAITQVVTEVLAEDHAAAAGPDAE